ncbi:MAG: AzlD domain-containing protein, partial [Kiritimatiellae bacterium]|nr:AzlD domain-containing protein [Kiritimatiellia bacterium]
MPQLLASVALCVAGVALTRFLPFLLFRPGRPTPPFVAYLGKWLGPAVFG